jgi:hypothetical protein
MGLQPPAPMPNLHRLVSAPRLAFPEAEARRLARYICQVRVTLLLLLAACMSDLERLLRSGPVLFRSGGCSVNILAALSYTSV